MDNVVDLFQNTVTLNSNKTAIVLDNDILSYFDLDCESNKLANFLYENGLKPGDRVCTLLKKSFEFIITSLAILKCGAAYIPIDPKLATQQRNNYILNSSKPKFLITGAEYNAVDNEKIKTINLNNIHTLLKKYPSQAIGIKINPYSTAYIIYTSGTTGMPKGVAVSHLNLSSLLAATEKDLCLPKEGIWSLFHSIAFDFSVWEIWKPLTRGDKLVLIPYWKAISPYEFRDLLHKEKINVLNQTPSSLINLALADSEYEDGLFIKVIILGGEKLNFISLQHWFKKYKKRDLHIYNMYGITEITVHATCFKVTQKNLINGVSNVGKPLSNAKIVIADEEGKLVLMKNTIGEIVVCGDGVAQGYINNDSETLKRFKKIILNHKKMPAYFSGDLGYFDSNKDVIYVSRKDRQIKFRGFRIELSEIEAHIAKQNGILWNIVLCIDNHNYNASRLTAFIKTTSSYNIKNIKNQLCQTLPDYMIPQKFIVIEDIPYTTNSKIDVNKLLCLEKN